MKIKTVYQFNFGHIKKSSDKRLRVFISKIVFYLKEDLAVTNHSGFSSVYMPQWFGLSKNGKTVYEGYFSYSKSKVTGRKNYYCTLSQRIENQDWESVKHIDIDLIDKDQKEDREIL